LGQNREKNFFVSPWVDFTNILQAAFMTADTKSAKDTDDLTLFALLGSV